MIQESIGASSIFGRHVKYTLKVAMGPVGQNKFQLSFRKDAEKEIFGRCLHSLYI